MNEHRGGVVNIPASVSGAPGFKSRPGDLAEVSSGFTSVHPCKCQESALKLGHYRFLPNTLQFIIHLSPIHSTLL
jgi:hypothetical protein